MSPSSFGRRIVWLSALVAGFFAYLGSPALDFDTARAKSGSPGASSIQDQHAITLDQNRRRVLESLLGQFKDGMRFSDEEAYLLHRFANREAVNNLEADVLITRALYDYYIANKHLTKEQE